MISSKQIIREFIGEHRWRIGAAFLAGLVSRLLALTIPLVIARYLALHFGYASLRSKLLSDLIDPWVKERAAFMSLMFLLTASWFACQYWERLQTKLLGEFLVKRLRESLFEAQMRTAPHAFARRKAGKYLLRYSGDLRSIQNFFNLGIMAFARDLLILIPTAILFAVLLPGIALPCLLGFLLLLLPLIFLNRTLYRASAKRRDRRSGLLDFVSERLHRQSVIQALNREGPEISKFRKRSEKLTHAGREYFRIEAFIRTLIPALLYLLPGLLFIWLEDSSQQSGRLPLESLSLGALLVIAMVPIFRRTARVTVHWELGKLSFRKLLLVMNLPKAETSSKPDLQFNEGLIEIKGLTLQEEGKNPHIFKWNAKLGPKGLTWIQGGNNRGKTQLLNVFLQIKQPFAGEIFLDGQNLREFSHKSIRKQIAMVSDSFPLLGKSVFEAISYSRKPEKRERAAKMLRKVQAALPESQRLGLDDSIGDLGSKLTSSQRVLLQFARAFLTSKPILFLDEPFTKLDNRNRASLLKLIHKLKNKRNVIVFSHQTPTELSDFKLLPLG